MLTCLCDRPTDSVEPVWPAESVGWVTEQSKLYYVFCAFYSLTAGKTLQPQSRQSTGETLQNVAGNTYLQLPAIGTCLV